MTGPRSAFEYGITQGFGPTNEQRDGPYKGYKNFNKGYDFAAPEGSVVPAMQGGTVISAGDSKDGWGLSVKVRDPNGFVHNYGHLNAVNVRSGDTIERGQMVGVSGNTGVSTGPHLSYDVFKADTGEFVDPAPWVGGGRSVTNQYSGSGGTAPTKKPAIDKVTILQQYIDGLTKQIQELEARRMATADQYERQPIESAINNAQGRLIQAIKELEDPNDPKNPSNILNIAIKYDEMQRAARRDALAEATFNLNAEDKNFGNRVTAFDRGYQIRRDQLSTDISEATRQNDLANADYLNRDRYWQGQNLNTKAQQDRAVNDINRAGTGKRLANERQENLIQQQLDLAERMPGYNQEAMPFFEKGGAVETLFGKLGLPFNAAAFEYAPETRNQGYVTVDPYGEMQRQDEAMGVSGPLPEMPELNLTAPPTPPELDRTPIQQPDWAAIAAGIPQPTPFSTDISSFYHAPPNLPALFGPQEPIATPAPMPEWNPAMVWNESDVVAPKPLTMTPPTRDDWRGGWRNDVLGPPVPEGYYPSVPSPTPQGVSLSCSGGRLCLLRPAKSS